MDVGQNLSFKTKQNIEKGIVKGIRIGIDKNSAIGFDFVLFYLLQIPNWQFK